MRSLIAVVALIQGALGARVLLRFLATSKGTRIRKTARISADAGAITVILPVLDEAHRIQPALDGLHNQGEEVRE
ncbi:MAG: glycosyltransferase family 2 protein, partial [Thermomicrobiales bacterium]